MHRKDITKKDIQALKLKYLFAKTQSEQEKYAKMLTEISFF